MLLGWKRRALLSRPPSAETAGETQVLSFLINLFQVLETIVGSWVVGGRRRVASSVLYGEREAVPVAW